MHRIANIMRSDTDPRIIRVGPSRVSRADRIAKRLGWFSVGLGAMEILAPRRFTRALGMQGNESLIRAYGVRELLSGIMSLSVDRSAGLRSRLVGDGLDAATLLSALRYNNPRKGNVALALLMVGGVAWLDYRTAQQTAPRPPSRGGKRRLYSDRSGFPQGLNAARGAARKLLTSSAAAAS